MAYRYFAYGGDNENGKILKHTEEKVRLTDEEYHINLQELSKTVEMLVIDSLWIRECQRQILRLCWELAGRHCLQK